MNGLLEPDDIEGDKHYEIQHGILTIGELFEMLKDVDDSTQIVIDNDSLMAISEDDREGWSNVTKVIVPGGWTDDEQVGVYSAVTLSVKPGVDPRQF